MLSIGKGTEHVQTQKSPLKQHLSFAMLSKHAVDLSNLRSIVPLHSSRAAEHLLVRTASGLGERPNLEGSSRPAGPSRVTTTPFGGGLAVEV